MIRYPIEFATGVQESAAAADPAVAVRTGAATAGQVLLLRFVALSAVPQAIA
jgi:hypothetical protein